MTNADYSGELRVNEMQSNGNQIGNTKSQAGFMPCAIYTAIDELLRREICVLELCERNPEHCTDRVTAELELYRNVRQYIQRGQLEYLFSRS